MKAFEHQPQFNKSVLKNGVRIITEHHPFTRTTSVGFFVPLGSRDEPNGITGVAHFLEHMLFKGTKKRNAYQIVAELEAVGGDINAYTGKEYTCYHALSLREHSSISLDVLADLYCNGVLDKIECEKEKEVVLQEIHSCEEVLEEYVYDLYFEKAFPKHALGKSILGTPQTLKSISRNKLDKFYRERYHSGNLIVAVSGDVDHEKVLRTLESLDDLQVSKSLEPKRKAPKMKKFKHINNRNSEQVHFLLGFPSSTFTSSDRFEAYIVNAALGGGMTSRFYQKIREEEGLAYSVYSSLQSFTDCGMMLTYVGTSADNVNKSLEILRREFDLILKNGLTQPELDFYKTQVVGNILIGADDVENRMNSIAVNEMIFQKYRSVEEVVKEIERINLNDINTFIKKYLDFDQIGIMFLGNVNQKHRSRIKLLFD